MNRLLITLCLVTFLGCSNNKPSPPTANETPEQVKKKIRELLPEAASVPVETITKLRFGGLDRVSDIKNFSLTMFLIAVSPPKLLEDKAVREAKLRDLDLGNVSDPGRIVEALLKSEGKGYATSIQPEYITDLTCEVKGDVATGVVSYEAKGVYKGRAEYTARRSDKGWRIEEFRLPGYKLRLTRGEDGKWTKSELK